MNITKTFLQRCQVQFTFESLHDSVPERLFLDGDHTGVEEHDVTGRDEDAGEVQGIVVRLI